jgi:enoyl-CoA hydratase/carnithine racemase
MTNHSFPSAAAPANRAVALIRLDNPPVNALSHSLRQRVAAELTRAEQDPQISAIVLAGSNELFSAGADVKEFNTSAAAAVPTLDSLIRRFEHCAGTRKEREIFLSLLQAPESRALRHVFFAERAAPRITDVRALV